MKNIKIRTGCLQDREALLAMYRGFDPLGAALGLPPFNEAARCDWIDRLLGDALHWVAAHDDGHIVGHAMLVASGPLESEVAFFVHQDFRGRRIGTLLVVAALAEARKLGYRRIWALVCSDNIPALKLLRARAFNHARSSPPTVELELLLDAPRPATESLQECATKGEAAPASPNRSEHDAMGLDEPHPARF